MYLKSTDGTYYNIHNFLYFKVVPRQEVKGNFICPKFKTNGYDVIGVYAIGNYHCYGSSQVGTKNHQIIINHYDTEKEALRYLEQFIEHLQNNTKKSRKTKNKKSSDTNV